MSGGGVEAASSEPRQLGMGDLAGVDVHRPELGAAGQGRHRLAGVQQALPGRTRP